MARINECEPSLIECGNNPLWGKISSFYDGILAEDPHSEELQHFYIRERLHDSKLQIDIPHPIEKDVILDTYFNNIDALDNVEREILEFIVADRPTAQIIIGDIGVGKSTFVKYIFEILLPKVTKPELSPFYPAGCFTRLNMSDLIERIEDDEKIQTRKVIQDLNNSIGNSITAQMDRHEEIGAFWDWMLENTSEFFEYKDKLRSTTSRVQRRNKIRDYRSDILSNPISTLIYSALRIRYLIEHKHGGDRTRMLFVFDNIDPMPPYYQRAFAIQAVKFSRLANCKVIIPMRTATYQSNRQVDAYIVDYVKLQGPTIEQVLEGRMNYYILNSTEEQFIANVEKWHSSRGKGIPKDIFPIKFVSHGNDYEYDFQDVQKFFGMVLQSYKTGREQTTYVKTSIVEFSDQILNGSIRYALILSSIFASSHILQLDRIIGEDLVDPEYWPPYDPRTGIPFHEFVRAIMLWSYERFDSAINPYMDNIFHVRCPTLTGNLLVQYRMLCFFQNRYRKRARLITLYEHLRFFEYNDNLIDAALSECLNRRQRLLINEHFQELSVKDQASLNDVLYLTSAGSYYINILMFQLEYMYLVIPDCFVSSSLTDRFCKEHQGMRLNFSKLNFNQRLSLTREFLQELHFEDMRERNIIIKNRMWLEFIKIHWEDHSFVLNMVQSVLQVMERINPIHNIFPRILSGVRRREASVEFDRNIADLRALENSIRRDLKQLASKAI